ncbi:MAG: hypothetical protein FJX52_16065, partial [Alphaproteobacteria bacterium]|nr:hypothetical protein [Alphaproteobacteria bacterium]
LLEDQKLVAKQPGDAGALAVVSPEEMIGKIKAAVGACAGTEIQIIARCDAYRLEGLAGAIKRGERYLASGAHALFIPGLGSVEDLAEVGRRFKGTHLLTAQFEGRKTWLPPAELYAMGYTQVALPGLLLPRVVHCIDQTLQDLARFAASATPLPDYPAALAQRALEHALKFDKWSAVKST